MFGTLQDRLRLKELRRSRRGITATWSSRQPLPQQSSTCRPQSPASQPRPRTQLRLRAPRRRARRHPLRAAGAHGRQRQHRALPRPEPAHPTHPAIATTTSRQGSGCTSIQTEPSPSSTAPMLGPLQRRRRAHRQPNPAGRVIRFDAARHALWTSGQPRRARPLPHRPNRINRSGQLMWYHKPVNSKCASDRMII